MQRRIGTALCAAALIGTLAGVMTGCSTDSGVDGPDNGSPATRNPTAGASGDHGLPGRDRTVGIYVAIVKAQRGLEPHLWRHATAKVRHHVTLPASYQAAISAELAPQTTLRWSTHPAARGIVVTLPVIPPARQRFSVKVSDFCGSLCGHFASFHVSYVDGHWVAKQYGPLGIS